VDNVGAEVGPGVGEGVWVGAGEPQKPGPEAVMMLSISTYWSVIKVLSHFKMTSKAPNCAVLALLNFVNGLTLLLLAGDWHRKYSRICEKKKISKL